MTDYDSIYHRFFTHPFMVEQLIRECVPEVMTTELDFSTMTLVNVKFYSPEGIHREGDVIWRVPTFNCSDIYLYFLFEFQSSIDRWMSVRTQVYTGLLWQSIIKEKNFQHNQQIKLPPVLPIVLYNGDRAWNAPLEVSSLIDLPKNSPLWLFQPQARYHLIDEGAFPKEKLIRHETLTALLFRLEHCINLENLSELISEVIGWFRKHPGHEELKKLFVEVISHSAKTIGRKDTIKIPGDLLEIQTMLATRAQEWKKQFIAEGRAEGKEEGRVEGRVEGKAEMLIRFIRRRFKILPSELEMRILTANNNQLDEWSERFIDAVQLNDIFD